MAPPTTASAPPTTAEESQNMNHPNNYGQKVFYTVSGIYLTILGALMMSKSRLVQTLTNPAALIADPSHLYRLLDDNIAEYMVWGTLSCSSLFPILLASAAWIQRFQAAFECTFTRIIVKVMSFSLSTLAFYLSTRVGTRAFIYSHIHGGNISVFVDNVTKVLDLQFGTREEVQNLVFVDPWTILTVGLLSVSAICLARLFPNPEPYYHLHEVLLDLTCHLAGDYFGGNMFGALTVFAICVLIIVLKEISEPPRQPIPPNPSAQNTSRRASLSPSAVQKTKFLQRNGDRGEGPQSSRV